MKTLKLILVTGAGAFALALFIWGVEVTIEYVLRDLMPKWLVIGLAVLLGVLVTLGLIVTAVYMLVGDVEKEDSELRVDALRAVGEMLLGTERVGDILSSENGQLLHALIQMQPQEWSAFKLYDADVACQDGCYYLFFVLENLQPTLLPIPFGAKAIACKVTNIYEYVGLRRKLLVTLYGIFRVFENVEHWIKIIVMSVCLALKKLLEKGAEKRLAKFAGELPQVISQQSRAVLPAGIALSQVSIQFELPSKPGLEPLLVDLGADLAKGIPKLAEILRRFAPFNWNATGFLKTPYAAE